jgi:50S ribosomal subunit-associated GTPase HflX
VNHHSVEDISHHSLEHIAHNKCLFEYVEVDGLKDLPRAVGDSTNEAKTPDGIVLVYDVGDRSSFTALAEIYQTLLALSGKSGIPAIVLANKVDMFQDSRQVDAEDGIELAEAIGGVFGQCSAREANGIKGPIQQLMKLIVNSRLSFLEEKELQEKEMNQKMVEQAQITRRTNIKRSMSERILARLSITSH